MPMQTSFPLSRIRLPQLPGPPTAGGNERIDTINTPAVAASQMPGVSLPFFGTNRDDEGAQEKQRGQGFVIQRDENGNIDWWSTLAQAGALAAMGIGAAKGNIPLAAAGSGFLQGRATGLEQRANRMEREAVRAEARAEREQAKQERQDAEQQRRNRQAEADFSSAVSRGDWELAETAIGSLPVDRQERARKTLEAARGRAKSEAATKKADQQKARVDTLFVGAMGGSAEEKMAAAQVIREVDPDRASQLEKAAQDQIATEGTFTDRLFSVYNNDIKNTNALTDLANLKTEINSDKRLGESQKATLLGMISVKLPQAQRKESIVQAQEALRVGDYKAAAASYTQAGFDTNATRLKLMQMDRHKEYRESLDRSLQEAQLDAQAAGKPLSQTQIDALQNSAIQRIETLTGYPFDPNVPDSAFEERADDAGGGGALGAAAQKAINDFVTAATKDVKEGRITLEEQLANVDEAVGTQAVPTQAVADSVKAKIRQNVNVGKVLTPQDAAAEALKILEE